MENNLLKLRQRAGISGPKLAQLTGLSQASISRIERGEQSMNDFYAVKLADFFHVSLDQLFGREYQQKEKIVYKEAEFTYSQMLPRLHSFSSKELLLLSGAIDYILDERAIDDPNPQAIKNELDRRANKDTR